MASTSIDESSVQSHKSYKSFDVLGRESEDVNQLIIYIYDDGSVEKKVILE